MEHYLNTAKELASAAGALLLEGLDQQKIVDKKSSAVDWVTQFDKQAEDLIVKGLLDKYPDHGIKGEEGTDREGADGFKWYIDPIDGTNNYAHGVPIFCVSIALYQNDKPLVGVIFDPSQNEWFSAISGEGAFLTTSRGERRLKVTTTDELVSSLLATGFPYDRHTNPQNNVDEIGAFIRKAQGIRRGGSAALDMAYVACGRFDGYWEYRLYAWDMAAARICLEEAGGKMTMIDGEFVRMDTQQSLIVSNGHIHEQMLEVIQGGNY
ncbi:MAG: inositol monophosphatase [Chloroflexi bacterium]|nr:MAG: inositol monophosphatase [Chloroflexota bacterium]MBL1195486.1 inositol monophosphatase [Chloroflexota bacterium]NOH12768.1 inositol monophosphatase [Chloroflexota bacterium]